jgi:hypothetical protein
MNKYSRLDAISIFGTSYLTLYQVCWWIRFRSLESCDVKFRTVLDNDEIKHLEDVIAGKAIANSKEIDAVLQLLAALEQGRIKVTARRNWRGNPRSLPAHYWPHLTFTNRCELLSEERRRETCVRFKNTAPMGSCWSDLLFESRSILIIWPPLNVRKQMESVAEDGTMNERAHHHQITASDASREMEREPRSASDSMIHKIISASYDEAEKQGLKPPNVKEIVAPVQTMLRDKGYQASGRRIQELAQNGMHNGRRRKPGATVASEKRHQHR